MSGTAGTKRKRAAAADGGVRDETFEKPLEELAVMWIEAQADLKARAKQTTAARKMIKRLEAALVEKMVESKLERVVVDDQTVVRSKTLNLSTDDEPVGGGGGDE
jgi:hypothetical protein